MHGDVLLLADRIRSGSHIRRPRRISAEHLGNVGVVVPVVTLGYQPQTLGAGDAGYLAKDANHATACVHIKLHRHRH